MPVIVGVDESGKGDFFGPLVIAALVADDESSAQLRALGARDSKLVSNQKLLRVDEELRAQFQHAVIVISPERYNRTYREIKNLNKLLAQGHADAIAAVLKITRADRAISDKFGKPELVESALARIGCSISLSQIVRGESILQVAAASILARARFLREMDRLSKQFGMELPRGASGIVDKAGREFVKMHGTNVLEQVSKVHFKNFQRATAGSLFK
ncbi:MAG: ribonuclease HIII [Candidatus Zixiibacteriota bacterium]